MNIYILQIYTQTTITCSSHNQTWNTMSTVHLHFFYFSPHLKSQQISNLNLTFPTPIGSMGLVYLPTWMVDFFMVNVGKYTIHGSYGNLSFPNNSWVSGGIDMPSGLLDGSLCHRRILASAGPLLQGPAPGWSDMGIAPINGRKNSPGFHMGLWNFTPPKKDGVIRGSLLIFVVFGAHLVPGRPWWVEDCNWIKFHSPSLDETQQKNPRL